MRSILKHFPTLSVNNSREIVRSLLERFQKRPSVGLRKRLERMGIGVDYTSTSPDDSSNPESVHLVSSVDPISDEELATYL